MSKVTLTRVFRTDQETKFGVKRKLAIQTQENGEGVWISSFNTKGTEEWVEGMEVDVEITQKGDFMNFKPLGMEGASTSFKPQVNNTELEARVKKLEDEVFSDDTTASIKDDILAEDIPFGDDEDGTD